MSNTTNDSLIKQTDFSHNLPVFLEEVLKLFFASFAVTQFKGTWTSHFLIQIHWNGTFVPYYKGPKIHWRGSFIGLETMLLNKHLINAYFLTLLKDSQRFTPTGSYLRTLLTHTHTPSRILGKPVTCTVKGCGEGSGRTTQAATNQSPPI